MIPTLLNLPIPGIPYVPMVVSPFLSLQPAVTTDRSILRPNLTLSYAGQTIKSLATSIPLVKKGVDYLAAQLVDPTLSPEYQKLQRQLQELEEASNAKTAAYESRLGDAASKEQIRQEEVQQMTQRNAALVEEKQVLEEEKQEHQQKAVKAEQEILTLTQERDALRVQLGAEKSAREAERMAYKEDIATRKNEHQQEKDIILGQLQGAWDKASNLENQLESSQESLASTKEQNGHLILENENLQKKTRELQEKIDFMVEKAGLQDSTKDIQVGKDKSKNFKTMLAKLQGNRLPRAEVVSPITPPITPHLGFQDQTVLPPTPQSLFARMFHRD